MKRRLSGRWKRWLAALVLLYIFIGLLIYIGQDLILFHPVAVPRDHTFKFPSAYQELNLPYGSHNVSILQFDPEDAKKGIVLFYHGNMHNVEHYAKYPAYFLRNGYAVWMIDYPGFGKSTGKRSEAVLYDQALLMYDLAVKSAGADSLVIYGKSIGTGIAAYVASKRVCRQLVLETPYYSMAALARHYFPVYPVVTLSHYSFPVHEYLKSVAAPVSLFHGTADEVIPYKQARRLKKENPSISLITIEGGAHNDLSNFPLYHQHLDRLLSH